MAVLIHFPSMHVLFRPCSRSLNDLLTTCHDFLTPCPRQFKPVGNNREHLDQVHRPLRTFQDPSPFFPDSPTTSQGRERSTFRSAMCDRGFSSTLHLCISMNSCRRHLRTPFPSNHMAICRVTGAMAAEIYKPITLFYSAIHITNKINF